MEPAPRTGGILTFSGKHRPMNRLNPDEIEVETFDISLPEETIIVTSPNDPTPATRCRWCPDETNTCP